MKSIFAFLFILALPAVAFSSPELKGSPEELRAYLANDLPVISISGSGELRLKADTTTVWLVVKTKEDKFQAALEKNLKIRSDVKARLVAAGIPADKIEQAKNSSTPTYSWLGDKPSSYEISNEINVTIDSEAQLLQIAGVVDSIKEVHFLRTLLKHTRDRENKTAALAKALDDVTAKKQLYEKALGVTLTPVRVIEQTMTDSPPFEFAQNRNVSSGVASKMIATPGESDVGESTPGFGDIVYKAQTLVEFAVHQKRP